MDSNQQTASSVPLSDIEQLVAQVEKDLLAEIMVHVEDSTLPMEEAQTLAQEFLGMLPVHDKVELLDKLQQLSNKYAPARAVYLKYAEPYYEAERKKKLEQMAQLIHSGNIDGALAVAKEEK